MMQSARAWLLLLLGALPAAASPLEDRDREEAATARAPVEGGSSAEPWAAEVLWDSWGVPHIYSDTELGLCFGFGYAHGRDHGPGLLEIAAIAAGRSAEFMGAAPWEALDVSSYVDRIPQSSRVLWDAMDNETTAQRYIAFAAGFDAYTLEHPSEYPRSEGFNQMSGLDWFRANMRVLFSFALILWGELAPGRGRAALGGAGRHGRPKPAGA